MKRTKRELIASVFDETQFGRLLDLECRRCERTGMRFALVLIHLDSMATALTPGHAEGVARTLSGNMRETDVTGWYRSHYTIGVILTTLNGTGRDVVEPAVMDRIKRSLSSRLGDEAAYGVRLSYRYYPEDSAPNGGGGRGPVFAEKKAMDSTSAALKRAIDVTGSLMGIGILSPVLAFVACVIRLTSPGPVFFRQTRVGQSGEPFTFLKFRSMYVDNDPRIHQEFVSRFIENRVDGAAGIFKIKDDPRVTPFGRILRKTSLDEMPQLLNVLKGDMSLVGPRPPIPYELDGYSLWHFRRVQETKPGMTGEWQVHGRSRTTFDDMVRMDLRYIRNQSFWRDMRILLKTPMAVLLGDGAE